MNALRTITRQDIRRLLPPRDPEAHKGSFGKLLLICGSVGYTGAPSLCARGALRCGAGLVTLCVPERIYPIVAAKLEEPVIFPAPCDEAGRFSQEAAPLLLSLLASCDACLLGCGLGRSRALDSLVETILLAAKVPLVLDADGLNAVSGHIDVLRKTACPVILTPHEGEFRRMGGDLSGDRVQAVQKMQKQTGATVLLKGHRTLIFGETEAYRNETGNPGMAVGGSGDVLAGMITALLGQGLAPTDAAALGAYLHGAAGDLCRDRLGETSMTPSDLLEALPQILK